MGGAGRYIDVAGNVANSLFDVNSSRRSASWPVHRSNTSLSCSPAPRAASPHRRPARTEHTALDVFHTVLAHGSSHGFLIATIFGIVAVGAALVLINVRKSDVGQATERAVVVA